MTRGRPTCCAPICRTITPGRRSGLELARRAAGSNADSEYGAELARIADEIAADRETLEQVMELLEVKPSPIKDAAGWTAEKFGRLKPNNSLLSYSPLSRVVELEGLVIGVTGKLALWESLRTRRRRERSTEIDFAALADRARDQRARLEDAARSARGRGLRRGSVRRRANARRASPGSA